MIKKFVNGWVIKIGKKYISEKGDLALLRKAKFFTNEKKVKEWEEKNPNKPHLVLKAEKNRTTYSIKIK